MELIPNAEPDESDISGCNDRKNGEESALLDSSYRHSGVGLTVGIAEGVIVGLTDGYDDGSFVGDIVGNVRILGQSIADTDSKKQVTSLVQVVKHLLMFMQL